jgi:ribose-phosphate pyrophosphokinase
MVVVDPHSIALEAMCGIPVEMLTAVPALASALARECGSGSVVVAPDLGAVKLAEHYASLVAGAASRGRAQDQGERRGCPRRADGR